MTQPATVVKDHVTLLKTAGKLILTKKWKADGTIEAYDLAKNFQVSSIGLSSLKGLERLLEKYASNPQVCAIRGQFIGSDRAAGAFTQELTGHYHRILELFDEVPHHWLAIDIDNHTPVGADPLRQPEAAIDQYIAKHLPACFQNVSYVWQLSSSAGAPGKEHLLKAHVFFWLKTPYTGPQLTAWARLNNLSLDVSVWRRVQPNFIAAPVFEEGVADPVPQRFGRSDGWEGDEVDLVIGEEALAQAHVLENTGQSGDRELVDPRQKPGLIGAFCRAYPIEEVIENWLSDHFQFSEPGNDRRLDHLGTDTGARGGAWIHSDREHIQSQHNSDPFLGRITNKWDLVRHYRFGHLDEGKDAFELMDISARPSHLAMLEFASSLEPVRREAAEAKREAGSGWKEKIEAARDPVGLQEVCSEIAAERGLDNIARHRLAGLAQERFRVFDIKLPIAEVRNQVGLGRRHRPELAGDAPDWARNWCFCTDGDWFFNLATKEKVTERGFNAMHTRFMHHYGDPETGLLPSASSYALNEWRLPTVSHLVYMPTAQDVFEMLGCTWGNLYRPGLAPGIDEDYKVPGTAGYDAVEIVKAHLRIFVPNRRERRIFASWLAHNVQQPGRKIRWAPYVHGLEGDGKSFFANLLSSCMGPINLRTVSGSTIEASSFTDWAIGYSVAVIEEMMLQGHNRYDVANKIKPFITNTDVEIHPKGRASYSAPNCTNYLVLSNYLDGAPVTESDRRYFFLSGALSLKEIRRLSAEGYFKRLFDILETNVEALRAWLLDFELDVEFDADGRAPESEARASAIELSRSDTETAAHDIIEAGVEGVCEQVVSSAHLSAAVKAKMGSEAELGTHRVNRLLSRLGYKFKGRHKWRGDHRRIWVIGDGFMWSEAKAFLDATIGKEFKNEED